MHPPQHHMIQPHPHAYMHRGKNMHNPYVHGARTNQYGHVMYGDSANPYTLDQHNVSFETNEAIKCVNDYITEDHVDTSDNLFI